MARPPLYKLPTFGRMTFRAAFFRGVLGFLLSVTAVAAGLTQTLAAYFRFPEGFGEPFLPHEPTLERPLLVAASLLFLTAVALLFGQNRRPALFFGLLAGILGLAGVYPIYNPYSFFFWIAAYRDIPELSGLWRSAQGVFWSSAALGFVGLIVYLAVQARRFREKADTHGSAAWATFRDLEDAELFDKHGIVLGLWKERGKRPRYIRSCGPHHVFVQGPPRSGKGVGIVQPTLLTWGQSALIHDTKGELWALTAGYRSTFSRCLRLDPTSIDGTAARYNPLLEIRQGPREVADVQNLCDMLVDPQGEGADDHWSASARDLLLGTILHVLYAEPKKTLAGVTSFLSDPARDKMSTLRHMLTAKHDPGLQQGWIDEATGDPSPTHPTVASVARAMLDRPDRELGSVFSTALAKLEIYRDPVVAANTATSDFSLTDLMDHEVPVSLYLTVPASDTKRARPIVRLLLSQALRRLTEDLVIEGTRAVPAHRHELLLMLDEFPLLGRLHFLDEALALVPGYGIRACLITQGISQHKAIYARGGRHESVITTCDVRVALAANDPESADYFSKLSGVMTVHQEKRDYRGDRFDLVLNRQYVRQHENQRPLVYPDEILRLPKDDILIFVRSTKPIRAERVKRYEDEILDRRSRIEPPPASDLIERESVYWEGQAKPIEPGGPAWQPQSVRSPHWSS